jgi:hypothetical protein
MHESRSLGRAIRRVLGIAFIDQRFFMRILLALLLFAPLLA